MEALNRRKRWVRRIGMTVFPAWEICDGFQVRQPGPDDWITWRRARFLVNLLDARGNRTTSKFLRPECRPLDCQWATWWRHPHEIHFVEVYDRVTRTASRFPLPNPGQWTKASFFVGLDPNGAVCVRDHLAWDPR